MIFLGQRMHKPYCKFLLEAGRLQCLKIWAGSIVLEVSMRYCHSPAPVIYVFWHLNAAPTLPGKNISLCAHSPSGQLQMEAHPVLLVPQPSTPEHVKKKYARTPSMPTDLELAAGLIPGLQHRDHGSADHKVVTTWPLFR